MSPDLRHILRLLLNLKDYNRALELIDAFISRETDGRFTSLGQFNGPLDDAADDEIRRRLLGRILAAMENTSLENL